MPSLLSKLNGRQAKAPSSANIQHQGISSSDLTRSPTGGSQFQDAQTDGLEEILRDDDRPTKYIASPSHFATISHQRVQSSERSVTPSLLRSQRSYGTLRGASEAQSTSSRRASLSEEAASRSTASPPATADLRQFLTSSNSSRFYNEFGAPRGQGPFINLPAEDGPSAGMPAGSSSSTLATIPVRRSAARSNGDAKVYALGPGGDAGTRYYANSSMPSTSKTGKGREAMRSAAPTQRMYKTLPNKPTSRYDNVGISSTAVNGPTLVLPSSPTSPQRAQGSPDHNLTQPPVYGYTPVGWDKQLDTPKVAELVLMCGEQIRARGLDSPLIFSSLALGLDERKISTMIRTYLADPRDFVTNETRFADAHDLAAIIKWALARLGRVYPVPVPVPASDGKKGSHDNAQEETVFVHQRGFLEIDAYQTWASQEKSNKYPIAAFSDFLDSLPSSTAALLVALLSLLSSTTSYSLKNGMTPSRLGRTFGSLVFGLPEDETFDKTYDSYVRVSNATEHLLLAYIRDMSATETLPVRLADHIRGYPSMLPTDLLRFAPGVKTIPITAISRTVRLYSIDLIRQCAELDLANVCPEWAACCASTSNASNGSTNGMGTALPQFSDRFRKLINLRAGYSESTNDHRIEAERELESYRSLADKAWGDFMSGGFAEPDNSKLDFDLYESRRKGKREPVQGSLGWNAFEEKGFDEADEGLDSALAFNWSIHEDLRKWPEERAELMQKLHKTNKTMPAFHYDTTPKVVASPSKDKCTMGQWIEKPYSKIDDVFPEVYADYLLCNGWSNRDELTHRNANFAIVQYKSLPTRSTVTGGNASQSQFISAPADARSDASWFVIEEVVPSQYRTELEAVGRQKNRSRASMRALSLFKRRKDGVATNDNFFDEVFRPNLGSVGNKKIGREPVVAELELERSNSQSTIRGNDREDNGHNDSPAKSSATSTARLLSSLKARATKKMARKAKPANAEGYLQTPPRLRQVRAEGSSPIDGSSSEFDAHSLQDSEIEALAAPSPPKKINKLFGMGRASQSAQDEAWLDVTHKSERARKSLDDPRSRSASHASPLGKGREVYAAQMTDSTDDSRARQLEQSEPSVSHATDSASDSSPYPSATSKSDHSEDILRVTPPKKAAISSTRQGYQTPTKHGASQSSHSAVSSESLSVHSYPPVPTTSNAVSPGTNGFEHTKSSSPHRSPVPSSAVAYAPQPISKHAERNLPVIQTAVPSSSTSRSPPLPVKERSDSLPISLKEPVPRQSNTPSPDGREKTREDRINAAKQRAAELRANLTPAGISEADRKSFERRQPSGSSGSYAPKDDPFSKDRISGRVASISSKFGGASSKPLSPQGTGSPSGTPTSSTGFGPGALASALSSNAAAKPGTARSGVTSPLANEPKQAPRGAAAWQKERVRSGSASEASPISPPPLPEKMNDSTDASRFYRRYPNDPNEMYERPNSDSYGAGVDTDSIYPEDAASNFSPDTNDEEARATRGRPGSDEFVMPPGSLFSNLHQSPAIAGAAAAAAIGGYVPPLLAVGGRTSHIADDAEERPEAEDLATDMTPLNSQLPRYQPGMPLSNVEEERESILSGSNV